MLDLPGGEIMAASDESVPWEVWTFNASVAGAPTRVEGVHPAPPDFRLARAVERGARTRAVGLLGPGARRLPRASRSASPVSPPERLTIDASVWIDYRDDESDRHPLARSLFALAERGEIQLWAAPQGYRLDLTRADSAEQLSEAFECEEVRPARQVARVSEVTFVGEDLIVGQHVERFVEAWASIAEGWPKAPGPADRFHVETHLVEERDVFITDDRRLLKMCRLLNDQHGFSIVAMSLAEYLEQHD
jgi:predicted nucleic acid-binding protein